MLELNFIYFSHILLPPELPSSKILITATREHRNLTLVAANWIAIKSISFAMQNG